MWIEKEKAWETFLGTLSDESREKAEDIKECLEIYARICRLRTNIISYEHIEKKQQSKAYV